MPGTIEVYVDNAATPSITRAYSLLPGGQRVALSGTSMAAPQVVNLAAKLLALRPSLQPGQLIELMVGTAERSEDGRRVLMHPRRALQALQETMPSEGVR